MTTLIVGGGIAGGAAACLLGPRATLVEREPGPHDKVCGEFISWEAVGILRRLGADPEQLGAACIHSVRLIHGGRATTTRLPGTGWGLSRRALDEALLHHATAAGASILRGHAVRRTGPRGVEVDAVGWIEAERVFLATGKHDLRGVRRAGRPELLLGLKRHLVLAPDQAAVLDGHVEMVLFRGGYAGLQPVEGGRANLCILIRPEIAGGEWDGVIAHLCRQSPLLARRLEGAIAAPGRTSTIFRVPYGFVHRPAATDPPNLFRLGDQAAVIPSFCGDGMALALASAVAAVRSTDGRAFHAARRAAVSRQIGRAMLLHRAGQAWPGLVASVARAWPGTLAGVARLTRGNPSSMH